MGGCCCCALKSAEHHRSPPFLRYPVSEEHEPLSSQLQYPVSEEHEPLSSHHAAASAVSPGLLVDTNLDTSIPDTYRSPPTPVPYERYTGHTPTPSDNRDTSGNKTNDVSQATNIESATDTYSASALEAKLQELESDVKTKIDIKLEATEVVEDELKKSSLALVLQDEEDSCPTCFEEYDAENPKIITKCNHHFHLGCILEWMERSDTCPFCDQKMAFCPAIGV